MAAMPDGAETASISVSVPAAARATAWRARGERRPSV
jgi:hypothetical protein